jgi:hypothetical protein
MQAWQSEKIRKPQSDWLGVVKGATNHMRRAALERRSNLTCTVTFECITRQQRFGRCSDKLATHS